MGTGRGSNYGAAMLVPNNVWFFGYRLGIAYLILAGTAPRYRPEREYVQ